MGEDPSAKVVYGYDLLHSDGGPKIMEVDEFGYVDDEWLATLPHYTEDCETLKDVLQKALDTLKIPGLELVTWGYEFGDHALGFTIVDHDWNTVGEIDPVAMQRRREEEGWDEKLAQFLEVVKVTPTQERPKWLTFAQLA